MNLKIIIQRFPGEKLKNMRNVHAHNYESVLYDVLWVTMKRDVPELKENLEKLI